MIATSVAFDVVFLVHVMTAVAVIVVFVTMRLAARSVAQGADGAAQALRFPERRNWAARLLHVMPVTGVVLSLSGGRDDAFSRPWVGVGLLCYLAAAGHLEARTLPEERRVAEEIRDSGHASPAEGRHLVGSIDLLLALVGVALLSMLLQF